jgi:hypothetical protein
LALVTFVTPAPIALDRLGELNLNGFTCLGFGSLETTFRKRLGSLTISSELVVW